MVFFEFHLLSQEIPATTTVTTTTTDIKISDAALVWSFHTATIFPVAFSECKS